MQMILDFYADFVPKFYGGTQNGKMFGYENRTNVSLRCLVKYLESPMLLAVFPITPPRPLLQLLEMNNTSICTIEPNGVDKNSFVMNMNERSNVHHLTTRKDTLKVRKGKFTNTFHLLRLLTPSSIFDSLCCCGHCYTCARSGAAGSTTRSRNC